MKNQIGARTDTTSVSGGVASTEAPPAPPEQGSAQTGGLGNIARGGM